MQFFRLHWSGLPSLFSVPDFIASFHMVPSCSGSEVLINLFTSIRRAASRCFCFGSEVWLTHVFAGRWISELIIVLWYCMECGWHIWLEECVVLRADAYALIVKCVWHICWQEGYLMRADAYDLGVSRPLFLQECVTSREPMLMLSAVKCG